jgi:ubiquinone/menaquinone biosynthesis C-methylase UbiE
MSDGRAAFKAEESTAYDEAAERFAVLSERYAGDLAARLLDLAEVRPGQRILDVGTGTGVVASAAAARAGADGHVVGIDISSAMLAQARARSGSRADRIEYRLMDAEALQLEDGTFDAVVSLFALLHLPDPRRAVGEMYRVLRPGGWAVVGVGSGAPVSLRGLVHRLGRLGGLWAERRGLRLTAPQALESMLDRRTGSDEGAAAHWKAHAHEHGPHELPGLFREAGFTGVSSLWQGRDLPVSTPEEFWDLQRTFSSRARRYLSVAPPALVDDVRREVMAGGRAVLDRGGRLVYPQGVSFVRAHRP